MRTWALVLAAAWACGACDLFQKPPADDTVEGDAFEVCEPEGALMPFSVEVTRPGEADADTLLLASGQAQVTYVGAATGPRADAGYEHELRLRFYDDAREVVLAVALPSQVPDPTATVGEMLTGVVWRRPQEPDGVEMYAALRDLAGNLRLWLVKGATGGPGDGAFACPYGLACPTATFAEASCQAVSDECGPRAWPALELRPAGVGNPVALPGGQVLGVSAAGSTWTFAVSYAWRYLEAPTCTDRPAAALAAAVLLGAPIDPQ